MLQISDFKVVRMNGLFRSATLKLTLWYVVIVMAISLGFSAVIYRVTTGEVARGLNNQTARIYRQYPVLEGDPFFAEDRDLVASSRHILLNLLYLNLAVLIGASLASYWLAKLTLQPIEAANEQQKRFVGDASHELRTPVTALKMETEVALMDKAASAPSLRKALKSNLEEANKLQALLSHLLRLSRLESDELEATFTSIAVKDVAEAAVERVASTAAAKSISIDAQIADGLLVSGDRESLTQLTTVLLDNAVKYSPARSTVSITATKHPGELQLAVRDHGVGIDPAALEHVFDRFYRADTSRSSDGYGLGLAIAKRIADLHHGTITLKSTVGKGTTAIVHLPINLDS